MVVVVSFLLQVSDLVEPVEKMVVIKMVPKPYRATDVVSVHPPCERSACLEIGILHGKSLLK